MPAFYALQYQEVVIVQHLLETKTHNAFIKWYKIEKGHFILAEPVGCVHWHSEIFYLIYINVPSFSEIAFSSSNFITS